MSSLLGWIRSSRRKEKSAENVALDKATPGAHERITDLETRSRKPSPSSSVSESPESVRRKKIRKLKARAPCDVIDVVNESLATVFSRRGFELADGMKLIGEGGFGKVILLKGNKLDRSSIEEEEAGQSNKKMDYACKIINAEGKFDKRFRDLGNELRGFNAGHSHPNIIQIYDAFIVDKKFYIIMEYADGRDLHRYNTKHGPLEEVRARRYIWQIGNAINFLHAQNIAHRDVKAHNVLLKTEIDPVKGDLRKFCKLTDMGLADICWTEDAGPVFIHSAIGTRHAMAPEVLENDLRRGSCPYNPMTADIWALGVILYEMLTRAFPFNSGSKSEMLKLQKSGNFNFKRKYPESKRAGDKKMSPVSDEAKHLVRMMFVPEPVARWTWREISKHPWMLMSKAAKEISANTQES